MPKKQKAIKHKKMKVPKLLKVKDLEGDEKFKDLHPNLPRPPSCCIVVGAIKSAKSNLVLNFLANPDFYKDKFEIVRVLSSTLHMDDKGKMLNKYFDCDDHYEDAFIDSCEKAIKRVESNRVNEEGLKLQKEFTYERTTNDILDLLYDL